MYGIQICGYARYRFPKELLKDFITHDGHQFSGTKVQIEKFNVSVQTAQDQGCINFGEFLGGGISIVDSAKKIKKLKTNPDGEIKQAEYISLLLKIATATAIATSTTNPIKAASAMSDATLMMNKIYDNSFKGSFEYNPDL